MIIRFDVQRSLWMNPQKGAVDAIIPFNKQNQQKPVAAACWDSGYLYVVAEAIKAERSGPRIAYGFDFSAVADLIDSYVVGSLAILLRCKNWSRVSISERFPL